MTSSPPTIKSSGQSEPTNVPGPSAAWLAAEDWQSDSFASAEDENFDKLGPVEKQKQANTLHAHKALGWCVRYSIILGFGIFWIAIVVYAWHMLTPWAFLTEAQVSHLYALIFNGTVGAVLAQGVKRVVD
jgi:hypothetical protein